MAHDKPNGGLKDKVAVMNRTGMGMSPVDGEQMLQGARDGVPSTAGSGAGMTTVHHGPRRDLCRRRRV